LPKLVTAKVENSERFSSVNEAATEREPLAEILSEVEAKPVEGIEMLSIPAIFGSSGNSGNFLSPLSQGRQQNAQCHDPDGNP
jgi:hypothetical protein